MADGNDLRRYLVEGWCIHLDLIPQGEVIFIPEPEEVNYPKWPRLRYRVFIDVLEVVDWHVPSEDSSSFDDSDSLFNDVPGASRGCLSKA
jgi:hypothetical protein